MTNTFEDFLKYTSSQKEVSLALAKDEAELVEFIKALEGHQFRQAVDYSDLFKHITQPGRVFVVVKDAFPKDMYDFIVQYPTGQVEICDKFNLKSKLVTPSYKDVSVIFLITKAALTKTQESGFRILEQVGITYQS